jgi:hypothetical protein
LKEKTKTVEMNKFGSEEKCEIVDGWTVKKEERHEKI